MSASRQAKQLSSDHQHIFTLENLFSIKPRSAPFVAVDERLFIVFPAGSTEARVSQLATVLDPASEVAGSAEVVS
jgi:hypothetical protein